jgi:hypothetical protein
LFGAEPRLSGVGGLLKRRITAAPAADEMGQQRLKESAFQFLPKQTCRTRVGLLHSGNRLRTRLGHQESDVRETFILATNGS